MSARARRDFNIDPIDALALAAAIRAARLPLSQIALMQRVPRALSLQQSTISAFERGHRMPSLAQLVAIEQAGEKAPGFILRKAGYLPDSDVRWLLASEPRLSNEARRGLLAAFDALIEQPD